MNNNSQQSSQKKKMMKKRRHYTYYKPNELVVDINDALLYGRDLQLLESRTEWLNDSCIHCYFQYLQQQRRQFHDRRQKDQEQEQTQHQRTSCRRRRRRLYYVDPAVISFFMHQCTDEDEIDDFIQNFDPLVQEEKEEDKQRRQNIKETNNDNDVEDDDDDGYFVFIPINDSHHTSSNWRTPGRVGVHWTLLLVHVLAKAHGGESQRYYHFDSSLSSGNIHAATDVSQRFQRYNVFCCSVGDCGASTNHDNNNNSSSTNTQDTDTNGRAVTVIPVSNIPQQTNSYDCGVHVLGTTKILSSSLLLSPSSPTTTAGAKTSTSKNKKTTGDLDPIGIDKWCQELQDQFGSNPSLYCSQLRTEIATLFRQIRKVE